MDTTFIIQGPLCRETTKAINIYKNFGKVIVSHWNTDPPSMIQEVYDACKNIVTNPLIIDNSYNYQNIKLHLQSTLAGLKECKTKFAIKVRSDEYFTNPQPLIDAVRHNPKKLTVTNFLFRSDVIMHPSDHVFASNTKDMEAFIELCLDFISGYRSNQKVKIESLGLSKEYAWHILVAEAIFYINWLKLKDIDAISLFSGKPLLDIEHNYRKTLKQHFNLVRASEIGDFLFRFHGNGLFCKSAYTSEEEFFNNDTIVNNSIKSFDDIQIPALRDSEYE